MSNYVVYHLHSDLSNGVTNIDSVTKFKEYIDKAKECGMNALAFSEHGNIFEWWHKKCAIEQAGMKYIHAAEAYITETLDEKIRDNYHCVLIARNYDGVKELNKLLSLSFSRKDNHFYYVPRISMSELFSTTENIIITTACLGSALNSEDVKVREQYLSFIKNNKERCFLEVQHHLDLEQIEYNRRLYEISKQYGIKLIAGTDTHALNDVHIDGRRILQKAKNISFPSEDSWDLRFKSYNELCNAYSKQNSLPEEVYLQAIDNTNLLSDMVQPFEVDKNTKYPKIYDNPLEKFKENIKAKLEKHPYVNERYVLEEVKQIVDTEIKVYEKTKSIDFMLLQEYLRDWEKDNGIQCGYSRGSVSGSFVAYILGITEMDSIKFGLNFFRFQNPSRITNCDVDSDYSSYDRDIVKRFLLQDHMNQPLLQSSEIITFNTIAIKGAIRDVGRALEMPLQEVDAISKSIEDESDLDDLRKKYPELVKYVEIVQGTIVSVGTHPSGVLISDLNINENIGMCSTSTSDYPISMLNMKELDDLMYVKLDILGLDNIGLINETCKAIGIDRLTPDNVDLEDINVWKSIRDDTTLIFQFESNSAQAYLRKFMSDETLRIVKQSFPDLSMIKWFSFGNGLLRPACSSYRNDVAEGKSYDHGFKELNEFLKPTMGYVTMQEDIMRFLVQFCGYSDAESDTVRRGIAKKSGTEKLLPEIEERFIEYSADKYGVPKEKLVKIIKPFLQVILNAVEYAFSWNHSDSYSCIGYICGYLRYYYPLEFLTAALNIFSGNEDKTTAITEYAHNVGIKISPAKFGMSKSVYVCDVSTNSIFKGMSSIKYMNGQVSDELYKLKENTYNYFTELLMDITNETSLNSKQLEILIRLDFFSDFGNAKELMRIKDFFDFCKQGSAKQLLKEKLPDALHKIAEPFVDGNRKDGKPAKSFTILNMDGLLSAIELQIKEMNIEDFNYKCKMQDQIEYLGYIDMVTNKQEDRRKLLVSDIHPLKSKESGDIWGYAVFTRSVGSGKLGRLTVRKKLYDLQPIKKTDIVNAINVEKNKSGFWYLLNYEHVV